MRRHLAVAILVAVFVAFALPALGAAEGVPVLGAPKSDKPGPHDAVVTQARELAQVAGEKVKTFATLVDEKLAAAAKRPGLAWPLIGVGALVGSLSMFFGWTLVQSLLIAFAPVLGLATGGVLAFCIVESLYAGTDRPVWFRVTLLAAGAGLGIAGFLFSALRAKPVAAFLVVMSPFLMVSAILFTHGVFSRHDAVALVVACVGFLMGFAAMIEVRPVAVVSTAVLGACLWLPVVGLTSHVMAERMVFLHDFFSWLTENPGMLAIAVAVLVFVGASFQFATGPRGTLDG